MTRGHEHDECGAHDPYEVVVGKTKVRLVQGSGLEKLRILIKQFVKCDKRSMCR